MFKYLQRIAILALIFLAFSVSSAIAQPPPTPTLLCLSVQDDGSLEVIWEVETGIFDGFRVFYNPTGDPTSWSVDFTPDVSSGIIHVPDADAKEKQYDVYIITYIGTTIAKSQTLKTIQPGISSQDDNSIAIIAWNAGNNIITDSSTVFRSIDKINFSEMGKTSINRYKDIIEGICDETDFYYYVEFTNDNCTFRSMTGSISNMSDKTAPPDPLFNYVTINADGFAVLHWSLVNPPSDLKGYQIEVNDVVDGWMKHATVGLTDSLVDNLNDPLHPYYQNPCNQVVKYVLKAYDQCLDPPNSSAEHVYEVTSIHNTIWLRVNMEANCQRKAQLTWNDYNNMSPPATLYEVWRSEDGAPAILIVGIATVGDNDTEEFTFTDEEILKPGVTYTYHISTRSAGSDKSSQSCRVDVVANPELLNEFNLDYLTVYNNEHIQLFGNGYPVKFINKVAIYRSATTADALELLTEVPWDSIAMVIPETSAKVNETAYYYQLAALDSCGYEIERSTIMRSIHLKLEDLGDNRIRLNWNAFEGWGDNLVGYDIYRMTNGVIDPNFPELRPFETLVYNDLIDPLTVNGKITYYIQAIRNDNIRSLSNEVLLLGEAEVILPNAFKPGSDYPLNQVFLPLVKNVETSNYRLVIYNRWGQMVFETNDPSEGWDGTRNGTLSPSGIYACLVVYSDYNGITHTQRGLVNLLK